MMVFVWGFCRLLVLIIKVNALLLLINLLFLFELFKNHFVDRLSEGKAVHEQYIGRLVMRRMLVGLLLVVAWYAQLFFFGMSEAGAVTLRLSVAASMKDLFGELGARYHARYPDVAFVANYGASGALAGQIEQGVPVDLFVSANPEWIEYLNRKGLLEAGSIRIIAGNELVFVGVKGTEVKAMGGLGRLSRIAIGNPKSVPAGKYAMTALERSGQAAFVQGKLVMARDVRECLMYAEMGEVDGAFVYLTDGLMAKRSTVLFRVPRELYPEIVYPAGILASSPNKRETAAFLLWLGSAEAKSLFSKYGFLPRE